MLNMQKKYLCQKNPVLQLDLRHPVQARKKNMTNNFYDTNALLKRAGNLFEKEENIIISSITLTELENIKTSSHKDVDIKYSARKLTHLLADNPNKYQVWIFKEKMLEPIIEMGLEVNNDTKILACAIDCDKHAYLDCINFYTNDLSLKNMAQLFFCKECIKSIDPEAEDNYTGYKEINLNEEELANFYSNQNINYFDLLINEYLLIKDEENKIIDILKWDGFSMVPINIRPIDTKWFGKITPYNGDPYQKMAFDSLNNNQLTVIRGPAGTGKSLCGLAYLFSLLEKRKIDKIYIFCNPVATVDSAKLGFYPGDKNDKLLDSQIGNFLISKLGDPTYLRDLVDKGTIVLLPAADCRGVSIPSNAGVYITEAQNSSIALMKLMIQRIEENVKCVIEGDDLTQVDLTAYQNENNGLSRLSKIFRNQNFYGEIFLKNCYRSKIAKQAELM